MPRGGGHQILFLVTSVPKNFGPLLAVKVLIFQVNDVISIHIQHVTECPLTKELWEKRADKIRCTVGTFYHCVPVVNKTLVEGCLPVFNMHRSDYCPLVELIKDTIIWKYEKCFHASGCPVSDWSSNNLFLYPKCLIPRKNGLQREKTLWYVRKQTTAQTETLHSTMQTGVEYTSNAHTEIPKTTLQRLELTSNVHIAKEPDPKCLIPRKNGLQREKTLWYVRKQTTAQTETLYSTVQTGVEYTSNAHTEIPKTTLQRLELTSNVHIAKEPGGLIILAMGVVSVVTCIVLRCKYLRNVAKIDYMPPLKPTVRPLELVREVNLDIYDEIEETRSVISGCVDTVFNSPTNFNESTSNDLKLQDVGNNPCADDENIQVQDHTDKDESEYRLNENIDNEEEPPQQRNERVAKWKGLEVL